MGGSENQDKVGKLFSDLLRYRNARSVPQLDVEKDYIERGIFFERLQHGSPLVKDLYMQRFGQ
jgi:hypothetical protein